MDFKEAVSFLLAIHAQGSWFYPLVGLTPANHAELCWRHHVVVHPISQATRNGGQGLRSVRNLMKQDITRKIPLSHVLLTRHGCLCRSSVACGSGTAANFHRPFAKGFVSRPACP
jgi:hypothetical protein